MKKCVPVKICSLSVIYQSYFCIFTFLNSILENVSVNIHLILLSTYETYSSYHSFHTMCLFHLLQGFSLKLEAESYM